MSEIDTYIRRANAMLTADSERDALMLGIDDMWHGRWQLPKEFKAKDDVREIIDMSPHDALKSGTAIMSTSMPHWTVQPLRATPVEQDRAERIAYVIDYNYRKMCFRGSSTVLWDIVHSALRYDAVAIWLDYLPLRFGENKTLRQKHALRAGNFVATVHNPRNVHVQQDAYGINCVLLNLNMTAEAVIELWPLRTSALSEKLKELEDVGETRFVYNDMMLYDIKGIRRIIWGHLESVSDVSSSVDYDEFVIMNEIIDEPFMPWIVQMGGSALDKNSKYSIHPLLAPLYLTHKWKDLNVFQSIMQSEIIKYGRAPRVKTITPSGDAVEINYEDGTTISLRPGEEAEAWKPAPIDPNLKELVDRVRAEVSATTLPRILQNPEFAGNTPFASINAMIQTALGGLNPAKTLCENVHAELGLRMIEWCKHAGHPLTGYRTSRSKDDPDAGSYVNVDSDELYPESVILSCKLFAEAPTDFAQRVNIGILMNQQLKVPRSEVLQGLGKENPDILFDQWVQEQYDDAEIMNDIQMARAKMQMALQMQAQAAQADMMAKQSGQPQGTANMSGGGYPSNTQGMESLMPEGQGYNPNVGGNSPIVGNPGVSLREMVSGQDYTGNGLV